MAENRASVKPPEDPPSEDPELVLGRLAVAIGKAVDLVGRDAVQRAFATVARQGGDAPLDPQGFASGDEAQGEVARRAIHMAVGLLAPAIGTAAPDLAGHVRRLGDGTRLPKLLTAGAATHLRHDPASRTHAVLVVRVAARVLLHRRASPVSEVRAEAERNLAALGVSDAGGVVAVELAILRASRHAMGEDAWEERKGALTPTQRDAVDLATRMATQALTPDDERLFATTLQVRKTIAEIARAAEPSDLSRLCDHVRFLLDAGTARDFRRKQAGRGRGRRKG